MLSLSSVFCFKALLKGQRLQIQLTFWMILLIFAQVAQAQEMKFELPVQCTPGKDCFYQNFTDLDPSPGVKDPWCGGATYNGHKGTDIRILTMEDIKKDVPVLAVADGKVKAIRDGVPDQLAYGEARLAAVKGRECGNGVVIDHGKGFESQLCHLKRGSISG